MAWFFPLLFPLLISFSNINTNPPPLLSPHLSPFLLSFRTYDSWMLPLIPELPTWYTEWASVQLGLHKENLAGEKKLRRRGEGGGRRRGRGRRRIWYLYMNIGSFLFCESGWAWTQDFSTHVYLLCYLYLSWKCSQLYLICLLQLCAFVCVCVQVYAHE